MYVPAPPAQPALALAPAGFASSELSLSEPIARYARIGLRVSATNLNVLDGQPATVAGALRPGLAGRIVTLQAFGRDGWGTIARATTGTSGRFRVRFLARHTGSRRVRLRFAGDISHRGSSRRLGTMNIYRAVDTWRNSGNTLGRFEACVIDAESGGNRYLSNGADWSYYQWTPETYNLAARMAGLGRRANPTEANLGEQTRAFRAYEPSHPDAWPNTVPMCS